MKKYTPIWVLCALVFGFITGVLCFYESCPTCPEPETVGVDTVYVSPDTRPVDIVYYDSKHTHHKYLDTLIAKITQTTRRKLKITGYRQQDYCSGRNILMVEILETHPFTYDTTCYRREECGEGER